ncbi:Glu-tRNA(Gln) amidotransferase subunit GatE [Candidatus Woesearchaeota archaeon]|nr:Glu-tRNA(Gln) amidotransferase subunit GatE [Candidatus Woesearchaeota archaeon]
MEKRIDYREFGFRCGMEIHQQLEGKKLFCNCPAINSTEEPTIRIERKLRVSASELGKVDVAAEYEAGKGRYFIYESNPEDTCLVEYDECPPYPMNQELLDTTLMISLLLNAKVVDEIQVMRKTVIDGSNTSGFQRTALVATDGYVETSKGKVRIPTICLEEEAAQKIEETKEYVRYRLDRLGIGLVEIATATDIKDPEHAKETASIIGMILRSTGKVKRGLGTIRQDVNVSIAKGARVEIKGFQELKSMPKIIEYEIERQLKESGKGKKLAPEVRKAEPDMTTSFLRPMPGADRMYVETDIPPIRITQERLKKITLPRLLNEQLKDLQEKYEVNEATAKELVSREDFEGYVDRFKNLEPAFIAKVLIEIPKEMRSRLQLDTSRLQPEDFEEVLEYVDSGKITKEAALEVLAKKAEGKKADPSQFKKASEGDVEKEIKKIIDEKPGLTIGAYMGLVMAKYRGKIDGKKAMDILKRHVK